MRRMADRFVNWLLSIAPWYHEAEIEALEERSERVRRKSIAARIKTESAIAQRRIRR